jgi:hypothetical protein
VNRILAATVALMAVAYVAPAGATTGPTASVDVDCKNKRAQATFTYTGFSPHNHLSAKQTLTVWGSIYSTVFEFDGPDAVSGLRLGLPNRTVPVTASTVVTGGGGRVKAEDTVTVLCELPPDPPPDPPRVRPRAKLVGPCGDPMYRAVFNNKRSTVPVTFRWRYHSFDLGGFVTLRKRVPAGGRFVTGYKHVTGLTPTTLRAHGELLLSRLTAPGGNYRPCR